MERTGYYLIKLSPPLYLVSMNQKPHYMLSSEIYSERRKDLAKKIGHGSILLPGNGQSSINYADNLYPFRQDSTFLYYTGLDRPDLYLYINIDNNDIVLFGDETTLEDEIWSGKSDRLAYLAEKSGIAKTKKTVDLPSYLKKGLSPHLLPIYRAEILLKLTNLGIAIAPSLKLITAVVAHRSFKSLAEITEIEKAVNISVEMQKKAMTMAKAGITELQIRAQIEAIAVSEGGHIAFPSIVTVNGQTLHNFAKNHQLKNGELLLCDCGAENNMHYTGDLSRTFPVNKTFTEIQKDIYNIVLDAYETAVKSLAPGIPFKEIHLLACRQLTFGLKMLGLIKGDVDEAVAAGAHTLFFPCGLGHMMGLDVHDMENLGEENIGYTSQIKRSTAFGLKSLRLAKELEAGFVLTVEPGIYFNEQLIDQWQANKTHQDFINYKQLSSFRNFGGIRIEDDFLITTSGSRLLGTPLPTTTNDIEAYMLNID